MKYFVEMLEAMFDRSRFTWNVGDKKSSISRMCFKTNRFVYIAAGKERLMEACASDGTTEH